MVIANPPIHNNASKVLFIHSVNTNLMLSKYLEDCKAYKSLRQKTDDKGSESYVYKKYMKEEFTFVFDIHKAGGLFQLWHKT